MERFADRITRGFDNAVNGRDRIDREFVEIGGRFFLINFSDQIGWNRIRVFFKSREFMEIKIFMEFFPLRIESCEIWRDKKEWK